jgi:hypothetical protein
MTLIQAEDSIQEALLVEVQPPTAIFSASSSSEATTGLPTSCSRPAR